MDDRLLMQRRLLVLRGKTGTVEVRACGRCGDFCVVCQERHTCCLQVEKANLVMVCE